MDIATDLNDKQREYIVLLTELQTIDAENDERIDWLCDRLDTLWDSMSNDERDPIITMALQLVEAAMSPVSKNAN